MKLAFMQVGDEVMLHLLKYTSIFLPVPCKKHYQVSGPPISDLCLHFSNQTLESQDQPTSLDKCGNVTTHTSPLVPSYFSKCFVNILALWVN